MITVTAKSFIGGFDPLNESPPMHAKNMDSDSIQKDTSTAATSTSTSTTTTTTTTTSIKSDQ